jgi:hypothetical protein
MKSPSCVFSLEAMRLRRWQDGKAMCLLVDKLCGDASPIDMQEVMNVRSPPMKPPSSRNAIHHR